MIEVKSSKQHWPQKGDKAKFRSKDGVTTYDVIVQSEVCRHADTDKPVLECLFLQSPDGPNVVRAVNADQVEPVLVGG